MITDFLCCREVLADLEGTEIRKIIRNFASKCTVRHVFQGYLQLRNIKSNMRTL